MARGSTEMVSMVERWGNSLALRIPQNAVDQLKLREGEYLKVRIEGDLITIRRAKARKRWTEEELLKGVTPEMCGPDLIMG